MTPNHAHLTFSCLIIALLVSVNVPGQSDSISKTSRRKPDSWFSLIVPEKLGEVTRHVDVDGGSYLSNELEITYNYWTYESTPNWLRGKYATNLLLACTAKDKRTSTWRMRIDGKRAVIQQCSITEDRNGFRYLYYVTFPKLHVFDGETFKYGMFNLSVKYKDPHHSTIAARIVRSLDFEN